MTVTIINGDCREVLRGIEHADVCITDPVWPNCPPGLLEGWDRSTELLNEALVALPESVRRLVIILRSDSDPRILTAVPARWRFICMQAMSYAVPMYLGRVLGGTEIAYCFGEPPPVRPGKRVIPMWGPKAQPSDRPPNGHPCSRALPHMDWLVSWWSLEGETVIDPFCGSGQIPLAAKRQNRHAIGIELDPKWAALAEQRVSDSDPLFVNLSPPRASQLGIDA